MRSTRRSSRRGSSPPTGWRSRPARTARPARSSGSARSCSPRPPPATPTSRPGVTSSIAAVRAGSRAGALARRAQADRPRRVARDTAGEELRGGAAAAGVELGRAGARAADRGGGRGRRRRRDGSPATGTPSSRATRRATGSRCCARRCAPCSAAMPPGTSGTWPWRSATSRSAPRRSPGRRRTWRPRCWREGDRYGVVMLSVRDVGTVPPELRRPDGLNRFRMRNAEEYATTAQLATEAAIVERARATGAAALSGPALELASVELQAAGLVEDQRDAVLQILSSGRRRRRADRPGRGREVPHGRRAGPRVGAADRRPGARCGDLEHRRRGCSSTTGSTR